MAVYSFLLSVNPRLPWPGLLALLLVLVAAAVTKVVPIRRDANPLTRLLIVCGAAVVLVLAVVQFTLAICYLIYPSYLDLAESQIAAVSWLGWEGHPLCPQLGNGNLCAVQYEPAIYQVTRLFLWLFGTSILASKVGGLLAFAAAQVLS